MCKGDLRIHILQSIQPDTTRLSSFDNLKHIAKTLIKAYRWLITGQETVLISPFKP